MRRTKHSIDHPASAPIQSDKQSAKVFIPYYPHVNKQISSILHRHSVSSACTSNKNLRDLLSSTKSRQPVLQTSNVIYQIPCKDCSATYCGQTSRPLNKRITEHERYTRPAYSQATDLQQSSALAQHAHASGHQIDPSSAVNTAIKSFQTDCLLRVFNSCYFHYSECVSYHHLKQPQRNENQLRSCDK